MTTITKERLLTIKQWRETYGPGSNVVLPAEEAEELARIALASLEAEPIAPNDVREQTAIPQVPVTPDDWISCSEQMPNEEDVLVYCSDTKEQMVGFHKGKGLFQFFYMNGVEGVCEPSHWMPLPEPPQEVK
ncbi:valyl-tRNA synthetase [Escherichia coli N36254PS]|nr:DUF551 domain-containing protein [Escherichia coli]EHT2168560.1 DUF551 domain-containing protein [Escherichia coli O168]EEY3177070.1 DUF551 domain-containing protein [Escherichia coli]EEY3187691.1 DUF551 domain-containing protein [Escherichia coli]EEY3202417.1 DUF551 domain-containing protein [Escherichia coli]EFE0346675.1 DUF551 domain-containing protein [Escherichia coli]